MNVDSNRFITARSVEVPVFIKMAEFAGYPIKENVVRKSLVISTEERCKKMGQTVVPHLIKASYVTSKKHPNVIIDGELNEEERNNALKELPITFSDIPLTF